MKKTIICSTLLAMLSTANARIWTATNGQTVDAEIVKINPDNTVVLKRANGKTVTVPFNTFVETDAQLLEELKDIPGNKLDPISWEEMNQAFGVEIWSDPVLWDDETQTVATRMELPLVDQNDYFGCFRSYPEGEKKILDQQIFSAALFERMQHPETLQIIYRNKEESNKTELDDVIYKTPSISIEEITGRKDLSDKTLNARIISEGKRIQDRLSALLGQPEKTILCKEPEEKVLKWDWNGHVILLSIQKENYLAVRIIPSYFLPSKSQGRDEIIQSRVQQCIKHQDNGAVMLQLPTCSSSMSHKYARNTPLELYFRYLGISADIYTMSLVERPESPTDASPGDSAREEFFGNPNNFEPRRTLTKVAESYNLDVEHVKKRVDLRRNEKLPISAIAKYIDKGIPIFSSDLPYFFDKPPANAPNSTFDNNGEMNGVLHSSSYSLIIGYNRKTKEVAFLCNNVRHQDGMDYGPRYIVHWMKTVTGNDPDTFIVH